MESALLCSYNHGLSLEVLYLPQLNSVPVIAPFSFFFQISSDLFYFSMNLTILHPNTVNSWLACSFSIVCPNFIHFAKTFQNFFISRIGGYSAMFIYNTLYCTYSSYVSSTNWDFSCFHLLVMSNAAMNWGVHTSDLVSSFVHSEADFWIQVYI